MASSGNRISRRTFVRAITAGAAALALPSFVHGAAALRRRRPNILFIMTDQQHAGMMSCTGNPWLRTPAMDSLAASGVRFERAYSANPVCVPARVAMMTGLTPTRIGMESNEDMKASRPRVTDAIKHESMGSLLKAAGYETAYGGKTHIPMTTRDIGFDIDLSPNQRMPLAEACAAFLKQEHGKPFLAVASFINPHDICFMGINAEHRSKGRKPMDGPAVDCLDEALKLPDGVDRGTFLDTLCPPLPENYAIPALEPGAVSKIVDMREFRKYIRAHWSDEDWRMHRWAYARLTERVDAEIAVVLDALRETRLDEDTVVIFTSDHGDLDAAHKLEHKSILYEEAMRVPFIISWKGETKSGVADAANLVSSGLDLIPTMCDYAGIEPPASLHGCSARPMAEGRSPSTLREYVPVETQFGRSIVTKRYKYNLYDSGAHREQLTDLEADPGEMNNLAEDEKHRDVLKAHRALLRDWIGRNSDATAEKYLV